MKTHTLAAAFGAALCLAAAADPAERLADPAGEARARSLFRETRCLVCQGESIDDSEADLARDLRRVIRGQVAAGRDDGEIRAFLARRYGDFVLFRPPLDPANAVLWGSPFLVALLGLGWLLLKPSRSTPDTPLDPAEEARIAALGESRDN
ncbi:MAG: cytochrome c-type biogenesis protein [Caulobacteraceae bacterium]